MAKKENDELIVDVEDVLSKSEQFIEDNMQTIISVVVAIVVVVGGYFAYTNLYLAGQEKEAQIAMFKAEQYFETNDFEKAITGDDENMGFEEIVDEYGSTEAGNLAHYYLGISLLKQGEYQEAIDHLESFDGEDQIVAPLAIGAIGDAYMELAQVDEAITYYLKAADENTNNFTTPIFLKKAALANEDKASYPVAVQLYERIKAEFPQTQEGAEIEKYISRAKVLGGL